MPKLNLTEKRIATLLRKPGRYRDDDVKGLLLVVVERQAKPKSKRDNGEKKAKTTASWQLRYEFQGRERWLGLGPQDIVSLKYARERARAARLQLLDGIDPVEKKKADKAAKALAAATMLTFEQAATQYFEQHERKWKNAKHRAQFLSTLREYAFPLVGKLAVGDVNTAKVINVLEQKHKDYPNQRLWDAIPETASRLRGRIEQVLDWATVRGYREGDNPARWKGHLDNVLPARGKIRKVVHHPALAYADIPAFMSELREHEGVSARALEFLILCSARTGAVRGARRDEIDFEQKIWSVPPESAETKISVDQPRRVPLSVRAIEILKELPVKEGNPHLFIGGNAGSGLSNMAMAELLKDMAWPSTTLGRLATVHGFRSTFKDWCSECTSYPNFVSEAALWHAVADKVERAYRRGDLFNKRRRLVADWAKYCASPPAKTGEVVPLRATR